MNIEIFFIFAADIVFGARCIRCVAVLNILLNFGSDADSVRFPVVDAVPTPISRLEPSVYMCVYYFFSIRLL